MKSGSNTAVIAALLGCVCHTEQKFMQVGGYLKLLDLLK